MVHEQDEGHHDPAAEAKEPAHEGQQAQGHPVMGHGDLQVVVGDDEVPEPPGWDAFEIMIILVIPSLIALAVCGSYALAMKTAKPRTTAHDYAYSSRAHLSVRSDRFLYHNVVRTPIVRDDDDDSRPSGGRPGGTTINAGGFSHKSGKF